MPMSDAVSSEGLKTAGIQQRSSSLSLTHRDSPVSLNLLIMLQMMRFAKPLNFMLLRVVFKVFHNLFNAALFHRLESLCPSLSLRDSASLRIHFIANHGTDLMLQVIILISC